MTLKMILDDVDEMDNKNNEEDEEEDERKFQKKKRETKIDDILVQYEKKLLKTTTRLKNTTRED